VISKFLKQARRAFNFHKFWSEDLNSENDPKKKTLSCLIPKGQSPFFGPFLKFGQAIVDAIFVQKISNFW
jgi:hypothetical protein